MMEALGELSVAIPVMALCVLISGFCSGTEVALFSLRRVDREQLAHSESARDRHIVALLERPRRLITTVLIGNEALAAVLAVVVLIVVARRWGDWDSPWQIAGVALALALPLVVLLAEVTAKTLAAKAPLAWARTCVVPLMLLTWLITPIRLVIHLASELLLRPLGEAARTRPVRDLSEQEFRSLVDAGSAQGQVDARERRLIHRVFEFSDKNVGQVMTPRDRIFALAYDLPLTRLVREVASHGFSRVPIYQKSLDNVRGTVHAKDLVNGAAGKPGPKSLAEVLHEPLFVPRTTPIKRLFLTFKQKKVHMAIVVSEYGKVLGLVTMDDLLAQIFGVILDERTSLQASATQLRVTPRVRTPAVGVVTRAQSPTSEEVTPPATDLDELRRDGGN
jgi:putative hemolysin